MKITHCLLALGLLALTACSTTSRTQHDSSKVDTETVMVTYHVKPGKVAELQAVLERAWQLYREDHLVFAAPHIVVRDTEAGGQTRLVEIFTWVSHAAPEHAPESVKALWEQEQSLCEARNGRGGIEGGEVEMVTGR